MYPTSNSDSCGRLNLQTRRGDTFNATIKFEQNASPEDLTGSIFAMRVICKGDPYKTAVLTFAPGDFIVSGPGTIEVTKSAAAMTLKADIYAYDLQQTRPDGSVRTRLAGDFIIVNDITP